MRTRRRPVSLVAVWAAVWVPSAIIRVASVSPWQNPELPVTTRVEDLISQLTLEEKVSLLQVGQPAVDRLELPGYNFGRECERGDTSGPKGTAFPSGLALASSFDQKLVYDVAFATAVEVRANVNVHTAAGGIFGASCYGPVSNLVKDSRWGRTNEMIGGEDPTLGRIMSRAFTWGIQARPAAQQTHLRMISTIAKHLNAYAGPEGYGYTFDTHTKRFNVNAHLTEREYREFFLPAFRGAAEANVSGYMASYSAITLTDRPSMSNNTPASANPFLLQKLVRDELGVHGYILSDAGAVAFAGEVEIAPGPFHESNRTFGHGYASSPEDAAIKCLEAGLDLELTCCGEPTVYPTIMGSIQRGQINESYVDRSLRNTLPFRFELGQLDPEADKDKNPYNQLGDSNVSAPWMLELAATASAKSVVLLKNIDDTLPLAMRPKQTICMVGPNANSTAAQMGGYVQQNPPYITTPYSALSRIIDGVRLIPGCNTTACSELHVPDLSDCDVFVAVLGLTNHAGAPKEGAACGCPYGDAVEGECCDRQDVSLPGQQSELLARITAAGRGVKPVVLVTINAGMLDLAHANADPRVGAIVNLPYLGMESGTAAARVLLGDVNPGGRLPLTYYTDIHAALGSLGDSYSMHPNPSTGMGGKTYRYTDAPVIWPFGYGLSYTSFRYSGIAVSPSGPIAPCTPFNVTVRLQNTGTRVGDEVAQLYLSIHNASVIVPKRQLVSFQRRTLAPQEEAMVTFTVVPDDRSVMRAPDFVDVVEAGVLSVFVGGSSDPKVTPGVHAAVSVVGPTVQVAQCPGGRSYHGVAGSLDAARWAPTGRFPHWP